MNVLEVTSISSLIATLMILAIGLTIDIFEIYI